MHSMMTVSGCVIRLPLRLQKVGLFVLDEESDEVMTAAIESIIKKVALSCSFCCCYYCDNALHI